MPKTDFVDESIKIPDDVPMAPSNEYMQGDTFDKGSEEFNEAAQEVMPVGAYYARFEKGEVKGARGTGNYQFTFDYVITAGDWRGESKRSFVTLEKEGVAKNMNWKLDEIMAALRAPKDPQTGNWRGSFKALYGHAVIIEIEHYQGRANVGKVSLPDAKAEEAAKNFV